MSARGIVCKLVHRTTLEHVPHIIWLKIMQVLNLFPFHIMI